MPPARVLIYMETDKTVPLLAWLDSQPAKVQHKVLARVERLSEVGHEMRRPEGDYLEDGIYELRIRYRRENYRVLYFFHEGRAVLLHGVKKEKRIPGRALDLARRQLERFKIDPDLHTYRE